MPLKIVVADNEPSFLQLMRSLATPLGHMVLTFNSSQEVGERAEKQRFDAFFLGMTEPEGLELAQRIRNSESNREATILILSVTDGVESMRKAFGQGADFVLTKPVTGSRLRPILAAMASPGWKDKRHAVRLPLFTEVTCTWDNRQFPLRSMNISESGMLLQPLLDIEVGQEVGLEFKIADVRATLKVRARIARKEGTTGVAIQFIGLAPEEQNAIQLYVLGHLKEVTPDRDFSNIGRRRWISPSD
jgi:CheY-like chemotaxis protein